MQLKNWADFDRFDVVILFESRIGLDLYEIVNQFAESENRRSNFEVSFKIDVSNITKVREKILSIKVSNEAKSWLTLFAHSLITCTYEDERGRRYILDKFNVLETLPCHKCIFRDHEICSKYALQPNRFMRSTILLAKSLAWFEGSRRVRLEHVRKACKYTLPLRLVIINESLKMEIPTLKALVEACIRDFDNFYNKKAMD